MPLTSIWNTLPWTRDAANDEAALTSACGDDDDDAAVEAVDDGDEDVDGTVDERALINAACAGDQDAFAQLVERHRRAVYRLAYRMVHDSDEAADIEQDVFLAAWRGLPNFRGDAQLSTWLHTITYHRCLRSLEAQHNRVAAVTQFASSQMERLANAWSTMQASLAEQQWCQSMQEQIDRLPVKYRMVLLLRHLQEQSYEEIAQNLAMPLSNVKTHLFRARAMLRERLQELEAARDANIATFSERLQALSADVEERMCLRGHLKPAE